MKKAKGVFIVKNNKGLHTRPSTELVKCSSAFNCKIQICYNSQVVNAKSLLGILMLAANKGSKIVIEAFGDDAKQAVKTLINLANNNFNIKY